MIKINNEHNNIGVLLSGGIASSMMLYLIAKEAKLFKKQVVAVTIEFEENALASLYSDKIVKYVSDKVGIEIKHFKKVLETEKTYIDEYETENFKTLTQDIMFGESLDIYYDGYCLTDETMPEIVNLKEGQSYVPKDVPEDVLGTIYPFKDLTKTQIAVLYKENDIEDMFPLTWSCDKDNNYTRNYTVHCGSCWSCKERYWAFNKY